MSKKDIGLAMEMRKHALALLESACKIDGLVPSPFVHSHSFGASLYLLWTKEPTNDRALLRSAECAIESIGGSYEPEKNESINFFGGDLSLKNLTGIEEPPPPSKPSRHRMGMRG